MIIEKYGEASLIRGLMRTFKARRGFAAISITKR
jgi:hypothetical protein